MEKATIEFINGFQPSIKRRGKELHEDGKVIQIFGSRNFAQAKVMVEDEPLVVKMNFEKGRWHALCNESINRENANSAIVASMLERDKRKHDMPETPNELGEGTLEEIVEEKLGRDLRDPELKYLEKVKRRYRRCELEGKIYDDDLSRLNPKWEIHNFEPLSIWRSPPLDIIDFWNYIAYAFYKKKIGFAPFLKPITNIEMTAEKLSSWERRKEEEIWRQRFNSIAESNRIFSQREVDIHLKVSGSEARFRWRFKPEEDSLDSKREDLDDNEQNGEAEKFSEPLFAADLIDLASRIESGDFILDNQAQILWALIGKHLSQRGVGALRLNVYENARLLNRAFSLPQIQNLLLTAEDKPFRQPDIKLRWHCRLDPKIYDQEEYLEDQIVSNPNLANYELRLVTDDGLLAPHSVVCLPGKPNVYICDDCILNGPPCWDEGSEIMPRYTIFANLIESEDGLAFLRSISCNIPENLKDRVAHATMKVYIHAKIRDNLPGFESEQLVADILAQDEADEKKGKIVEKYLENNWQIQKHWQNDGNKENNNIILDIDRNAQNILPSLLEDIGINYDIKNELYKTRITKQFPQRFAEWAKKLPPNINLNLDDQLKSLLEDPLKATLKIQIDEQQIDWFDVKAIVDVKGLKLDKDDSKKLLNASGDFVRLKNGKWARIDVNLTQGQKQALERLGVDPYDFSGEAHRMHAFQIYSSNAAEAFDEKSWQKVEERAANFKLHVEAPIPKKLKAQLRPYQVDGYHFLAYLHKNNLGGVLADDMGLGKTLQSITWLLWLIEENKKLPAKDRHDQRILVVCPKSVLEVWSGEIVKFAPILETIVVRYKSDLNLAEKDGEEPVVYIINYAQLRIRKEQLQKVNWLALILDEGQQIKNPQSQAHQAACSMQAHRRLVLTGTPIENRPLDIWSIMTFAMPGVLGKRSYFTKHFDRRKKAGSIRQLSARLRPFLLRRTKSQVSMDLPPKTEEDMLCSLEGTQKEMYENKLLEIQKDIISLKNDDEARRAGFTIIQGMLRLRQICCHPALIDNSLEDEPSAKLTSLFYLLDQIIEEGHKALIFSQFVSMLDIIAKNMEERGQKYFMLTGKTQNRGEIVSNFQNSKDAAPFLLSLKAGGSGLNLTAASYVVLYDPWWNPAVENQAIDRTHRIGQENPVNAYRIIARDTIEEKIRKLQIQKQKMSDEVLGGESFSKNLTLEDLRYLFSIKQPELK